MDGWQKLLLAAGGAAGAAAVLYWLLKEEENAEEMMAAALGGGGKAEGLGKKEILEILQEMAGLHKETSERMKELSKQMITEPLGFEELYDRVKAAEPVDPLEKRGLTMNDLQGPVQRFENDQEVMMAVQKMMSGGEDMPSEPSAKVKETSTEKLLEMNLLMLEELKQFIADFHAHKAAHSSKKFDIKTVVIASQALLDSKITAKYGLMSDDVQAAIMLNQAELSKNAKFLECHMQIQSSLEELAKSIGQ